MSRLEGKVDGLGEKMNVKGDYESVVSGEESEGHGQHMASFFLFIFLESWQ